MKKKLVLIDGNSLAYRAFFALPPLTNQKGQHTNAAYGFTMMLQNILKDEKPTHMLLAWDAGKKTFRHDSYEAYKGGRDKTPSELREQFTIIREIVDAFQIKQYELPSYEADDIIGTLSQAASDELEVVIISGDKDLTQLVTDRVTVYITRKGIKEMEKYTPAHIEEKYGLTPEQIIDMKGLMGDPSDNIPGVPGVGEKTAIKLLKQYGTMEGVYEHLNDITAKKLNENLTTYEEQAFLSKQLVTIHTSAPIEPTVDELVYNGPDEEALYEQFKQYEFNTLLKQLNVEEEVEEREWNVTIVTEESALVLPERAAVHLEYMDENYLTEDVFGLLIRTEEGNQFIVPEVIGSSERLKTWLESEDVVKEATDSKAIRGGLARYGVSVSGFDFDLTLAAYIDDASVTHGSIEAIASHYGLNYVASDDNVYGKGAKKKVPALERIAEHAATKAEAVHELRPQLIESMKENEQLELLNDIEIPLALILSDMETTGIEVDRNVLQELGIDLRARLETLEATIYELAGEPFNINSPKQLSVVLFEDLGLTPIKKTKTGYSTAADVLEKLESEHPIISHILLYRQLGKLNSTYVEGLEKEIHSDGKIHTRFQQALTQTGRLSSVNPNLQNIPIRLEEGRNIRKAFVPSEEGWQLLAADYSQIELRIMAHISQDEKLVEAFRRGADIHTETAMSVFGVSREEVTSNMRRSAKAVNFGIIYGISDYGLSQNLGISRYKAKQFIDTYFETFPGVKQFMEDVVKQAKKDGYVTTLMHRRRYLPELNDRNFNVRSFGERTAINTPIQGSAADIIKKAMIDMKRAMEEWNLRSRLLLQVHDELIFEVPEDEIETMRQLVPQVMEETMALDVPLRVDANVGTSWYDV